MIGFAIGISISDTSSSFIFLSLSIVTTYTLHIWIFLFFFLFKLLEVLYIFISLLNYGICFLTYNFFFCSVSFKNHLQTINSKINKNTLKLKHPLRITILLFHILMYMYIFRCREVLVERWTHKNLISL